MDASEALGNKPHRIVPSADNRGYRIITQSKPKEATPSQPVIDETVTPELFNGVQLYSSADGKWMARKQGTKTQVGDFAYRDDSGRPVMWNSKQEAKDWIAEQSPTQQPAIDNTKQEAAEFTQPAETAKKSKLIPQSRMKVYTDERLSSQENRDEIERMKSEFGWAEEGGKLIRGTDGEAASRTKWIPLDERVLWTNRPDQSVNPGEAKQLIQTALDGKPLPAKGHRLINYLLDVAQTRKAELDAIENEHLQEAEDLTIEEHARMSKLADNFIALFGQKEYDSIQTINEWIMEARGIRAWFRAISFEIESAIKDGIYNGKPAITTEQTATGQTREDNAVSSAEDSNRNGAQETQDGFALEGQTNAQVLAEERAAAKAAEEANKPPESKPVSSDQDDMFNGNATLFNSNRATLPAPAESNPAELKERYRTSDYPSAVEGWRVVGGGQKVPGASSEKAAKIEISEHPEWKGATIVPFDYFDGSVTGKYSELSTRYAILVKDEVKPLADNQSTEGYGLPKGSYFSEGKGALGSGKWMAHSEGMSGNLAATKKDAAESLLAFISAKEASNQESQTIQEYKSTLAYKIKSGEQPTITEWRQAFPQLRNTDTYIRQPEISQFLIDNFGVSRNTIKKSLGEAAGDITSDGGVKYPIVYFNKLVSVFGEKNQSAIEAIKSNPDITPSEKIRLIAELRKGKISAEDVQEVAGKAEASNTEDAQDSIDKTGGVSFMRGTGDKPTLIIQHNLSEANLLHAERLGGIPVPSLAITSAEHHLTSFGEITLVGGVDMADPKGYAATKVFGADIYSPRYPNVEYQFTSNMKSTANGRLKEAIEATNSSIPFDDMERRPDDLAYSAPIMWQFLKDNGIEPKIVYRAVKPLSKVLQPFADGLKANEFDYFDMQKNPAFIDAAYQAFKDKLVEANGKEYSEDADAEIAEIRNRAKETGKNSFVSATAQEVNRFIVDSASNGDIDRDGTKRALKNQVYEAKLRTECDRYSKKFFIDIGANERIFQGYTNSGNRKYIPHTLDNVIKLLKKNMVGGENFNYGVGTVRSKFAPQFKTIKQIREAKDRLMSDESFSKIKKEIDDELGNLANEFSEYHSHGNELGFYDTMASALYDSAKMGLPRAFRENGFEEIPAEKYQLAAEFIDKLRGLPTAYFEAKILRAVDLSEFKGAVVPENISQKALDILAKRGITNVVKYSGEADRAAKIKQLATDAELLFGRKNSKANLPPVSESFINDAISRIDGVRQVAGDARITVVFAPSELPTQILKQAEIQGVPQNEIHGVLHNGRAYIVRQNLKTEQDVEEVLAHEVLGHGGVHALLGDAREGVLLESFNRAGGISQVRIIASRLGVLKELNQRIPTGKLSNAQKIAVVDEMLALAQGKQGNLRQAALEWVGKIRNFIIAGLRKVGLNSIADKLDKFDSTEAATMLRQMRKAVIEGGDISGHGVAFMVAWHGSPHDHNKFDSSKIGTGEGAAVYGYGLYFAEKKEIAEYYKNALGGMTYELKNGETLSQKEFEHYLEQKTGWRSYKDGDIKRVIGTWVDGEGDKNPFTGIRGDAMARKGFAEIVKIAASHKVNGKLYQVDLAPSEDEYLLWDRPLSKQSEKVKAALKNAELEYPIHDETKGEDIYLYVSLNVATGIGYKAASEYLHSLGIRGIKYLDGGSRSAGDGNFNYVIFSDSDISITAKYSRTQSEVTSFTPSKIAASLSNAFGGIADRLLRRGEEGKRGGVVVAKDIADAQRLFAEKTGRELGDDVLRSVAGEDAESQRQFREVELAYGGKEGYAKAKLEGKTKLGYGQWIQVRTANFKNWFGDWDSLAIQNKFDAFLDNALTSKDPQGEFSAREVTVSERNEILKQVDIDVAGMMHSISASWLKHAKRVHGDVSEFDRESGNQRQLTKEDMQNILVVIDSYDWITANKRKNGEVSIIYSKKMDNGTIEYVERVIETSNKNKPRLITKTVWVKTPIGAEANLPRVYAPERNLILPFSNGRVNPDSVSKVVDPETGEPMVVYHGTTYPDIYKFLPNGGGEDSQRFLEWYRDRVNKNEKLGYMSFRSGTFFSPQPEYAGNYTGENKGLMYPVFISVKNPVIKDSNGKITGFDRSKTIDSLILKENGTVNEISVIEPNKIKSAIGNNGQFDANNPDIRYSEDGVVQGIYDPKSGLTFLIANHLNDTTAPAVLAHEILHGTDNTEIRAQAMKLIEQRDSPLVAKTMREFLNAVNERMVTAKVEGNETEAANYIVEQALIVGRKDGFSVIDNTLLGHITNKLGKRIGDIVRSWVASVRVALLKRGMAIQLTVDDLIALSRAGMKQAARGDVNSDGDVMSRSKLQFSKQPVQNELPEETGTDAKRREYQDSMIRFKRIQQYLKETGIDLSEAANVYERENLSKATTANKVEDFRQFEIEPLLKRIAEAGISISEIADYLEAVHIPEANKRMREIHRDATATANGVTDEEAIALEDKFKARADFAKFKVLAEEVRSIGAKTLQIRVDNGLLSQQQADNYTNAYEFWIPLRGDMDKQGIGKGMSTSANTTKRCPICTVTST